MNKDVLLNRELKNFVKRFIKARNMAKMNKKIPWQVKKSMAEIDDLISDTITGKINNLAEFKYDLCQLIITRNQIAKNQLAKQKNKMQINLPKSFQEMNIELLFNEIFAGLVDDAFEA